MLLRHSAILLDEKRQSRFHDDAFGIIVDICVDFSEWTVVVWTLYLSSVRFFTSVTTRQYHVCSMISVIDAAY